MSIISGSFNQTTYSLSNSSNQSEMASLELDLSRLVIQAPAPSLSSRCITQQCRLKRRLERDVEATPTTPKKKKQNTTQYNYPILPISRDLNLIQSTSSESSTPAPEPVVNSPAAPPLSMGARRFLISQLSIMIPR